ncbi:hypothetical protein HanPSC8_Chr11g0462511 [Helianthus annuus]|nr:hypothetical protein HanPSC8_Chr11g0462511 [Helianthus annuus]
MVVAINLMDPEIPSSSLDSLKIATMHKITPHHIYSKYHLFKISFCLPCICCL